MKNASPSTAATPPIRPDRPSAAIRVRAIGSPANSAASGLDPTARTRAPNRVRVNTTVSATVASSSTHTDVGMPAKVPPSSVKKAWSSGIPLICLPSAKASAIPRKSIAPASVTMNDGSRRYVVITPLRQPRKVARAMITTMASHGDRPSRISTAPTTMPSAYCPPSDRSTSRMASGNTMPQAMSPT